MEQVLPHVRLLVEDRFRDRVKGERWDRWWGHVLRPIYKQVEASP